VAVAIAKIPGHAGLIQMAQREQMRISQIGDVHIVADAGSILGGVVVAEYLQRWPAIERGVDSQRHQV
jgi:hypothetical protein